MISDSKTSPFIRVQEVKLMAYHGVAILVNNSFANKIPVLVVIFRLSLFMSPVTEQSPYVPYIFHHLCGGQIQ